MRQNYIIYKLMLFDVGDGLSPIFVTDNSLILLMIISDGPIIEAKSR